MQLTKRAKLKLRETKVLVTWIHAVLILLSYVPAFFFLRTIVKCSKEENMWRLSMSRSGSGARAAFPSEHKERKGVDKQSTPEPSWLGTNHVCSCLPAREPPQKVRGLGELFGGGRGETFPSQCDSVTVWILGEEEEPLRKNRKGKTTSLAREFREKGRPFMGALFLAFDLGGAAFGSLAFSPRQSLHQ